MNRVKPILDRFQSRNSPEFNMAMLLEVIDTITIVPRPDKYYVFVYQAKTPNLKYDQHPFIVCTTIHRWGFIGFNFHWNDYRRYSWNEVLTNLHELNDEELTTVQKLPIAKFKIS